MFEKNANKCFDSLFLTFGKVLQIIPFFSAQLNKFCVLQRKSAFLPLHNKHKMLYNERKKNPIKGVSLRFRKKIRNTAKEDFFHGRPV